MNPKTLSLFLFGVLFLPFTEGFSRPLLKRGQLAGILVAKGEFWIEIKDDNGYTERYLAPWRGLGPTRGGGFDPAYLTLFKELIVGNRVTMQWSWDGHLRVEEIEIVRPGKGKGMFEGYLLEIGDRWIDVQNTDERIPWRFYLPWVGGYPENGGGFDQKVIEPLREHQPTNPILFEWSYLLRPRIIKLVTREEISFKPFYELEEIPPWLGPPGGNKNLFETKPINPFDIIQEKQLNPFDTVAPASQATNPFDSVDAPPSVNPFDATKPSGNAVNPFEQSTNPFDSSPSSQNPFEQSVPKQKIPSSNPFDQVPPSTNPFENIPPSTNPFDSTNP